MNIAFAKNKNKYKKIIKKQLGKVEVLDYTKFLNQLGIDGQQDVRREITALRSPANSQATINAKGSSNPLIDSGHMRQSVTYIVKAQ